MFRHVGRKSSAVLTTTAVAAALVVGAAPANAADWGLHVYSGPIEENKQMIAVLTTAPAGTPIDVYMDSKKKATVPLQVTATGGDTLEYISYDRSWGLGVLQVRSGDSVSKPVRLRAAVKIKNWEFKRIGKLAKKLRITVTAQQYDPARNSWVKSNAPILQAKDGTWKKVRTLKLNKKGKASIVLTPKKALKYRFVVKQTKKSAATSAASLGRI